MIPPERSLKHARACSAASTILFVVFCLLGGPSWNRPASVGGAEALRILSRPAGIVAWSLLCTACGVRRPAH